MDRFWFAKKGYFSTHAKPTNKEKLFLSATKLQPRTAPKLTEVSKFYLRNPTVSLQYNSPFSKLRSLASAVQLPFRTDSNPHRRYPETLRFRCRWLHDDGRSLSRKPCIERRFESSPGVQRVATLDLLETWSPCSRPFAILPVSAVSDAQKLATGNFLHVRAATFSYFL